MSNEKDRSELGGGGEGNGKCVAVSVESSKLSPTILMFRDLIQRCAPYEVPILLLAICMGFLLLLVPAAAPTWQAVIYEFKVLKRLFVFATTDAVFAAAVVFSTVAIAVMGAISAKSFPNWDVAEHNRLPNLQEFIDHDCVPRTAKQKVAVALWFLMKISIIFMWFGLFGVLGHVLVIGGSK